MLFETYLSREQIKVIKARLVGFFTLRSIEAYDVRCYSTELIPPAALCSWEREKGQVQGNGTY